mmetsp:Transcript_10629/g.17423  ORF Transcript_10629/g.17423 Transcript_10629/m.17423 type:complete len:117 (+) Transcript_10629:340-690(+)
MSSAQVSSEIKHFIDTQMFGKSHNYPMLRTLACSADLTIEVREKAEKELEVSTYSKIDCLFLEADCFEELSKWSSCANSYDPMILIWPQEAVRKHSFLNDDGDCSSSYLFSLQLWT